MGSLKAVLLDADGVFQRPPPDLAARLAEAMGLAPSLADEFILDLFRAEAQALTGAEDFFACAQLVLSNWGLSFPNDRLGRLWHQIEIDGSVLSLVTELRGRGIYCAVVSNQQAHRARCMSVDLAYGEIFDAEFYSCQVGHRKPSGAYFKAVIKSAKLDPGRTVFIDDRVENVDAARRAGLNAVLFAPTQVRNGGGALRALLAKHGL